ncbi:MAG: hypothetical protein GY765_22905, partial [bacterium]|nr:hypothetical protein [bacterium]
GGHSLKAVLLIAKIHKALQVQITLPEIFRTPTIRQLARTVASNDKVIYSAVQPVEKKEYYPVSSAQKRMYILQRMEMSSTAYNMPHTITLSEAPDVDKLEKTFTLLINRHESLRTSFHIINEKPVQRVRDNVDFTIDHYNLTSENTEGTGVEPHGSRESNYIRPFDLSMAPLLRVGLVKKENSGYLLLVDMHHIISDGISHQVLLNDYTALHQGETLPSLRIQYKDFSQWLDSEKQKEKI